jgi:RNA polymerase sigma factor (sigma-70 family)
MAEPCDAGPPDDGRDLEALYARGFPRMLEYARSRLGDDGAAEDAVHDTFASAAHALRTSPDLRITPPYLWTALRRRCQRLDMLRDREMPVEPSDLEVHPRALALARADAEQMKAVRERAALLERAIEQLPPGRRAVVEDHIGGYTYEEISKRHGIKVKTVDATLQQAKAQLRASAERERGGS